MTSSTSKEGDFPPVEDKDLQDSCPPKTTTKAAKKVVYLPPSKTPQSPLRRNSPSSERRRHIVHPVPILGWRPSRSECLQVSPYYIRRSPIMSRGIDPSFRKTKCRNPECNLHRRSSKDYISPSECLNFPPSTSANHIRWTKEVCEPRGPRFKKVEEEKVDVSLVEKVRAWCRYKWAKKRYEDMLAKESLRPKRKFRWVCKLKERDCKDELCMRHDPSGELDEFKPKTVVPSAKGKHKAVESYPADQTTAVTTADLGTPFTRHSSESDSKPVGKPLISLREAAEREIRAEKLDFLHTKYEAAKNHWLHFQMVEAREDIQKMKYKKEKGVLNEEIRLTRQAKKMAEIKLERLRKDNDAGKCDEEEWQEVVEATTKAKKDAHERLASFDSVYAKRRKGNLGVKALHAVALTGCKAKASIPKMFTNAPHVEWKDFEAYVMYHRLGKSFRPVFHKAEEEARAYALWLWRRAEGRRRRELGKEMVREGRAEERKRFVRERWEMNRVRMGECGGRLIVEGGKKAVRFEEVVELVEDTRSEEDEEQPGDKEAVDDEEAVDDDELIPLTPEQVEGLERYRRRMSDLNRSPREGLVRDSWGKVVRMAREEEDYFVENHGKDKGLDDLYT